jgi:hypothetical protein
MFIISLRDAKNYTRYDLSADDINIYRAIKRPKNCIPL